MRKPKVYVTGITVNGYTSAHRELSAYVIPICESDADFEAWRDTVGRQFQLVPIKPRFPRLKRRIGWLVMGIPGLSALTVTKDGELRSNWHFRIYERAAKWVNDGAVVGKDHRYRA